MGSSSTTSVPLPLFPYYYPLPWRMVFFLPHFYSSRCLWQCSVVCFKAYVFPCNVLESVLQLRKSNGTYLPPSPPHLRSKELVLYTCLQLVQEIKRTLKNLAIGRKYPAFSPRNTLTSPCSDIFSSSPDFVPKEEVQNKTLH